MSTIASTAADSDLEQIVEVSRRRNALANVTGALLFTGVRFAQCIEGPEAAVQEIRASIARDTRHKAVTTLLDHHITERQFGAWSLAYVGPSTYVSRTINQSVREVQAGMAEGGEHLRSLLVRLARQELSAPV